MKPLRSSMLWIFALVLFGFSQVGAGQQREAANAAFSNSCAWGNTPTAVTVHAAHRGAPFLSLCDGRPLTARYGSSATSIGQARPLTLAAADFDEDGVPDLVSGSASGSGGQVIVHRGNVNALWPYGAALREGPPPAFLPDARVFALPEAPDFLVTGDFDADGHWDMVTAQRGSDALYFLKGDGHGGFAAPQRISVAGSVTAMIAGEINRADGLADLIVAVSTANGARALVFESPMGALRGQAEIFKLLHPASALALGRFDGGAMNDLAVASGNQIVVIHARDRKLTSIESRRALVAPARVSVQSFSFAIDALAAGDFTGEGPSLAALGEDGKIHILEHSVSESTLGALADPNFRSAMQLSKPGPDGKQVIIGSTMTPSVVRRLNALRRAAKASRKSPEWTERSPVQLPAGFSQTTPRLVTAHVTGSLQEDLLAVDSNNSQIHVLSTASIGSKARASETNITSATPLPLAMRLLASLDAASPLVALLPMRLNQHGLNGLVILQAGQIEPTLMPETPANVFTVTNTLDSVSSPPAGSLRAAINSANDVLGTSSIVFDIPITDPGYNPATGEFLIQPLSSAAGLAGSFALPPVGQTMTIDGYTQPGASPNTMVNGDNAKILIRIDGTMATASGGCGLVPYEDVGSTFRGMAFTGWNNPAISSGGGLTGPGSYGAEGIQADGLGDFFEGNFFGTDITGKVAIPNLIGIIVFDGALYANQSGNMIGGTTPQARNVSAGNTTTNAFFGATSYEASLEGNFIGTDSTGAAILANGDTGVTLGSQTITIGGTLPGAGNVISGNPINVDINDLLNGGQASDSIVQGNLIGTDVTGTQPLSIEDYGVSILHNPQSMLIGGTTPAARNIISGNQYGVYIFDNAFYNNVQGNYIGVDVTGTKALGNIFQGIISGSTTDAEEPASDTTIGGLTPGSGNVISGNAVDGIEISGTNFGPNENDESYQGNDILGNFIGTDFTGQVAIPNQGNGIYLSTGATNNLIGYYYPGSGNLIANNIGSGVLIDPGSAVAGEGVGNITVGNTILSNTGSGVQVNSGSQNRISRNSIFANGALGINLNNLGANLNTNCNSTNTGPNDSQNAPVLTAGTGDSFISATATDPNGNTSEFSNTVQASLSGNILSLLGSFNSLPSTAYTIEFFSSTASDPSGFGQGQTYLGSTKVTTGTDCSAAIDNPVNTADADMSVTLTENVRTLQTGPDFGGQGYSASVTNLGPATAHNALFTDALPTGIEISNAYCNLGACQSPVTTTLGTCSVSGNTVTCNLGTMAAGAFASIFIPVQTVGTGSISNTATVSATETDPNPANNTDTVTGTVSYPLPQIDHLDPAILVANPANSLPMNIYGYGLLPITTVTFNGSPLTVVGYLDNQTCVPDAFSPATYCAALQVVVPATMLTTANTVEVLVTNPNPLIGGGNNSPGGVEFTIVSACSYQVNSNILFFSPTVPNEGTPDVPDSVGVEANAPECTWTATSTVPWATILTDSTGVGTTGNVPVWVTIAPNSGATSRSGSITVAGQTFPFQQDPGATCDYLLSPTSATFSPAGGTGSVQVTGTNSSCDATVASYTPWITIPGSSGFGLIEGSGTATYTVAPSNGQPQTGYVVVGGYAFPVTQSPASCYFTLSTNSALVPASGGTGSIGVTASPSNCAWTATTTNSSKVSITSGASGTGNGTVNYSVPANTEGPQTPTITIGNQADNATFTVQQASAFTCTFSVSPTPFEVPASGTSGFFYLSASYSFCNWSAASSDPAALTLTEHRSGSGSAEVGYAVGQNTGGPRTMTITAGCQIFTINQDGASTSNPVPAITSLQPSSATAGSGAFTLTVNGSSFVSGAVVNFNGNARTTTFLSANQVSAAILATDVASAGTPSVTVTNPSPGGGPSNALTFSVTAKAITPTVTVTPSAASITTKQALTVTVDCGGGSGQSYANGFGNADQRDLYLDGSDAEQRDGYHQHRCWVAGYRCGYARGELHSRLGQLLHL
jgi:hypothetical protein